MPNPVRSAFIYLMHLAWKSRLHIPFLLTVCFLVFDIRLQLEVNINMTRRRAPHLIAGDNDNNGNYGANNVDFNLDDDGDVSENDDDDEEEDDDDDDDNNDSISCVNGVTAEECKRIYEQDIETITNIINILPSLRVPFRHSNSSSKVLFIGPSVFQQLNYTLDKHYKKTSLRSFKTLSSVIFKSQNNHRCIL